MWRTFLFLARNANDLLQRFRRKLNEAWEAGLFAHFFGEFLLEVAVLLFVFPELEIII